MSQIKKIGVVGAGNMGSGIAQKIAQEGLDVVLIDTKIDYVDRGLNTILKMLQQGVERNILTQKQVDDTFSRINGNTDMSALADADLVVEAIFEDKDVKSELFGRLDSICQERTILATNTSSFYVEEFARQTSRPDRFVGLHYFFHPAKNRLLEVIPHDGTSNESLETALLFARLHGKTPIVVKDAPGFAVNRFFVPFLNEAARALAEGIVNIPTIEEANKRIFGIGMGPFELMNVTGIPIAVHSATTLGNELGSFYEPAAILQAQMESGQNWDLEGDVDEDAMQSVMDRAYGACLFAAASLVDEGVASMEDTDRGAKIGLRWTNGPFEICNRIGIENTCDVVALAISDYSECRMPAILDRQKATQLPFEFSFVDLEIKDDIAYITINRPEAMNALNPTVVSQLDSRFSEAERNPAVKGIVFQGAGKTFISGADIRYFVDNIKGNRIADSVAFTQHGHDLFLRVENSDKMTIALLDGLSLGGGSEFALACQAIVATEAGSIGFPETGIGIYPGLGGMIRLARQVGAELAKYYVLTGKSIRADALLDLGIVTRLADPAELDAAIRELVAEGAPDKYRDRTISDKFDPCITLASSLTGEKLSPLTIPNDDNDEFTAKTAGILGRKAPLALKVVNDLIDRQQGRSILEAIELELAELEAIFSTADALTGLSSVGGKSPRFEGK